MSSAHFNCTGLCSNAKSHHKIAKRQRTHNLENNLTHCLVGNHSDETLCIEEALSTEKALCIERALCFEEALCSADALCIVEAYGVVRL